MFYDFDSQKCAYCGEPASEKEDVVPRYLLADLEQKEYKKIPACRRCNLEKSKSEEDLRDVICLLPDLYWSYLARYLRGEIQANRPCKRKGSFTRALKRGNRPDWLHNTLRRSKKIQDSSTGREFGRIGRFDIEDTRCKEAATWIFRGLAYLATERRIEWPSNCIPLLVGRSELPLFTERFDDLMRGVIRLEYGHRFEAYLASVDGRSDSYLCLIVIEERIAFFISYGKVTEIFRHSPDLYAARRNLTDVFNEMPLQLR